MDPEKSTLDLPRLAVVSSPTPMDSPQEAGALDLKPQVDYLWNTHKYKNDYIRFADTKAAFTVAFCSALLAALYKDGIHHLVLETAPKTWGFSAWMALLSFLSLAAAISAGVWTIRPRLGSRQPRGLIYWGAIAEHGSPEAFWNSIRAQSQEQLAEHLAHHVFALSELAKQKYRWVTISMTAAAAGGTLTVMALLAS